MSLRDYIGVPYQVHGVPPGGADCYSLVRHYAQHERGIYLPPYMYQADTMYAEGAMFIAEAYKQMGTRWKLCEQQPDAVVVFRVMGLVMHCGFMLEGDEFLHAFEGRDSCVESLTDFYWAKRVEGFFTYD